MPVIDFLGTAHPHGCYWVPFLGVFGVAMTAMRVLISWLYLNTGSVLAAQLLHMSSTGALVVFKSRQKRVSQRGQVPQYPLYFRQSPPNRPVP